MISGKSDTSSETRWIMSASAWRSTPGCPRTPCSSSDVRIPSTISAASSGEVGASRNVTSRSTSTRIPPSPNVTTGPKVGSLIAPISTSCPSGSIRCTCTPVMLASALYAFAFSTMESYPEETSSDEDKPTSTPFASVLWRMSGDTILSTTG